MKLLVEEALVLESSVLEEINENTGIKEKNYYIEGVFSTMGEKNRNGRIYSTKLWEDNVVAYQKEIENNTINTLGECEHPSRVAVDPMKAVMKIESLFVEGKFVKGKARILNNNMNETNQIKALIDVGMPIGVSSRGTGRMKGEIVEAFELRTYDIVQSPSDYNANLKGLREAIEKEVVMDYTTEDYVCANGECMLETKSPFKEGQTIFVKDNGEFVKVKVDQVLRNGNARYYIGDDEKEIEGSDTTMYKLKESTDPEDVEYYGQLTAQAKKDKKSKSETVKILKKAGAPKDIIADMTQGIKESCCSSKADSLIEALNKISNKKEIEAAKQADIDLIEKFNRVVGVVGESKLSKKNGDYGVENVKGDIVAAFDNIKKANDYLQKELKGKGQVITISKSMPESVGEYYVIVDDKTGEYIDYETGEITNIDVIKDSKNRENFFYKTKEGAEKSLKDSGHTGASVKKVKADLRWPKYANESLVEAKDFNLEDAIVKGAEGQIALIKKSVKAKDKKETIKQADYMIEYMNDLKKAKVVNENKGLKCPKCGSTDVDYVAKSNNTKIRCPECKKVVSLKEAIQDGDLATNLNNSMHACETVMKRDGYYKEYKVFKKASDLAYETYLKYDQEENGKEY